MSRTETLGDKKSSSKAGLHDRPSFCATKSEPCDVKDFARYNISSWECHRLFSILLLPPPLLSNISLHCITTNAKQSSATKLPHSKTKTQHGTKSQYKRANTAERPSPSNSEWTKEKCSGNECSHKHCETCWDLDAIGTGDGTVGLICVQIFTHHGFEAREWRPYKVLKNRKVFKLERES
jgi:hypothetical protein